MKRTVMKRTVMRRTGIQKTEIRKTAVIKPSAKVWQMAALLIALTMLGSFTEFGGRALAQTPPDAIPTPTAPAAPAETQPEAQPESSPVQVTVRCRRRIVGNQCLRLRATFFEEERRLRQFRDVDFLEAALDGAGNTINSTIRDPDIINSQTVTDASPDNLPIEATVTNRNPDSSGFLRGSTFENEDADTSLELINVQRDSNNPQRGRATIQGTVRGRTIDIRNGSYRASGSQNGDIVGGVVVVTDPNNPRQELQIVIPPTRVGTTDDEQPITAPGRLSIGRGVDR